MYFLDKNVMNFFKFHKTFYCNVPHPSNKKSSQNFCILKLYSLGGCACYSSIEYFMSDYKFGNLFK